MGDIFVGTAGWTDKSLVDSGLFYPPDVKTPEERLRFYAENFPLVEVDSSYYGLPNAHAAELWAERTPPGFQFNVKAYRIFTGHQTPLASLPKDLRELVDSKGRKNVYYKDLPEDLKAELWTRFRAGIEPLKREGKLVAVHFQFAPWLAFHPENFAHLEECRTQIPDAEFAVEFRNESWFDSEKHRNRTLEFLQKFAMTNVVVDAPEDVKFRIPSIWETTNSNLALVRLHGRNRETWNKKGLKASSERFNYDYTEPELQEIAGHVRDLSQKVQKVHVILNNNYQDQGQRNGRTMQRLLQGDRSPGS